MIARYTREEMQAIWTNEMKFQKMLEVEVAVAEVQGEMEIIPESAARNIKKRAKFDIERIDELERVTKHDVIAFVTSVAEAVGEDGRFIHFGLTSSDVVDTALSLQVREAYEVLKSSLSHLQKALIEKVKEHESTLCAGRTHGMHAEPTTFGLKLAGHLMEFQRASARLERAVSDFSVGKLSGAVGTYSAQSPEVEARVCKKLGLQPETVATQVIPRDRHADVIVALAFTGAALERLSIELRHLQRTELSEVQEGFSKGQKGSSAMPHKRNPISAENLTGISRLLKSYAQVALDNIALWHERDISHSSVERVIFPDAFIACDYAVDRMAILIRDLEVHADRMKANMDWSYGQMFSSHVLLALVNKGLSREEAYEMVQSASHQLKAGQALEEALKQSTQVSKYLSKKEIEEIFSGRAHQKAIHQIVQRVIKRSSK